MEQKTRQNNSNENKRKSPEKRSLEKLTQQTDQKTLPDESPVNKHFENEILLKKLKKTDDSTILKMDDSLKNQPLKVNEVILKKSTEKVESTTKKGKI